MNFSLQETTACSTGSEGTVMLGFIPAGEQSDCLMACGAALHVDIQITPGTYRGPSVSLILTHRFHTFFHPGAKDLYPLLHIIP
jgi:hypothetical protein